MGRKVKGKQAEGAVAAAAAAQDHQDAGDTVDALAAAAQDHQGAGDEVDELAAVKAAKATEAAEAAAAEQAALSAIAQTGGDPDAVVVVGIDGAAGARVAAPLDDVALDDGDRVSGVAAAIPAGVQFSDYLRAVIAEYEELQRMSLRERWPTITTNTLGIPGDLLARAAVLRSLSTLLLVPLAQAPENDNILYKFSLPGTNIPELLKGLRQFLGNLRLKQTAGTRLLSETYPQFFEDGVMQGADAASHRETRDIPDGRTAAPIASGSVFVGSFFGGRPLSWKSESFELSLARMAHAAAQEAALLGPVHAATPGI